MGIFRKPLQAVFAVTLSICLSAAGRCQEPLSISAPSRTSFYPEAMCVHCVVPTWDQHYLLHLGIDRDPALVTMYDRDGKKVVEGRVSLPGTARISLRAAGASRDGHILAAGGATMTDGSIQHFVAEIGSTGRTVQSIQLGEFAPQQACAATDGTIWTLGYDWGSKDSAEDSAEVDSHVLCHYDFAKGLLGRYVSLTSVSPARDAVLLVDSPRESFLRCQRDRISVLFWSVSHSVAQYIVLNASLGEVRWRVIAPYPAARANGFALTDDGGVFVSLDGWSESENTLRHGLYKLQATSGNPVASLIPVGGTITAIKCHDCNHALPDGTFTEVFGAEGDELVVLQTGDWGLSWTKVSTSVSNPD